MRSPITCNILQLPSVSAALTASLAVLVPSAIPRLARIREGSSYAPGNGIQRQLGTLPGRPAVTYRDGKQEDLARARAEVAAWRKQNPEGTAGQLVAELGSRFHRDYGPLLRAILFNVDGRRDLQGTPSATGTAVADR
jgi:hypothetical protein